MTTTTSTTEPTSGASAAIDPDRLQHLVEQAVGDFGAVLTASLVVIGDRLGLYRALRDLGPSTSAQLADATGTVERNVREWLSGQAAAGYVSHQTDPDGTDRWSLSPEQAVALTDETSPAFITGGFQVVTGAAKSDELVTEAFRTGSGLGWHRHHHDLFTGTERFFRPGYAASLVSEWLPALPGIVDRLQVGGRAADVGCGHGASSIVMARAFPQAQFSGSDLHAPSIEAATRAAQSAGVTNVEFEVAAAAAFTGDGFDLICFFDCLHDMGDPVGALRHARAALADDGAVLLVEPFAGDRVADNLNPIGRLFYSASTLICTPASQSQEIGRALGAQAGPTRLAEVATEAGFRTVRTAASTPVNLVLELRP
ncbi:MAG TPA: class I SAM-dependent methyltransferase [Microlunatus sp.]|nr:class I SAM-dependent methyltransferase [Microlunatus sp.]